MHLKIIYIIFLESQPDLNFHNLDVQQQLLDDVEFWLKLGVDGIRLDACNFYFHDQQLRNNPPVPQDAEQTKGVTGANPGFGQRWYGVAPYLVGQLRGTLSMANIYTGYVAGELPSHPKLLDWL